MPATALARQAVASLVMAVASLVMALSAGSVGRAPRRADISTDIAALGRRSYIPVYGNCRTMHLPDIPCGALASCMPEASEQTCPRRTEPPARSPSTPSRPLLARPWQPPKNTPKARVANCWGGALALLPSRQTSLTGKPDSCTKRAQQRSGSPGGAARSCGARDSPAARSLRGSRANFG